MGRKIVIIGGVAGGASTAARLRRNEEDAHIILLERGEFISFANCGLPYYIGNTIAKRGGLLLQTPKSMKDRFNIDVRVYHEAVGINAENKHVCIHNMLSGEQYVEHYDKLVIATGASPVVPPIKGIDNSNVFTIWSIPDTDRIKTHVTENSIKKAVIIGGGFVGLEMAENLRALNIEVTVVEMIDQVMAPLDFDMAQIVHKSLNENGVGLCLSEEAQEILDAGKGCVVKLKSGKELSADMVISAVGIKPNSKLASDAGLTVNAKGYIVTDEYLRTSNEDIYAVGDVIEINDFITGNKTAVPLAGPANKQGRIAADNISGRKVPYKGALGTSVVKIFELTAAATGMSEKKMTQNGKKLYEDYMVVYGHPQNHASYYPGGREIHMKLIFDAKDGKIYGAQAVGQEGTEKRIDVIAACIKLNGTVYDLTELDLSYAPPFGTAKDPVNFMGFMAENILENKVDIIKWNEMEDLDLSRYQIVDCRTIPEFEAGAIPGSVNVPVDAIRDHLDKISKDKSIAVYCKAGLRSYVAARILTQNGFQHVRSMTGGYTTYEFGKYKAF